MRWLTVLLLLANVSLFGWAYYQDLQGRMLQRLRAQSAREIAPLPADVPSLRLLAESDELPPLRQSPEQGEKHTGADTGSQGFSPATPVTSTPPLSGSCYRIGPFTDASAAEALQDGLRAQQFEVWRRQKEVKVKKLFWVYLEPMGSAEQARQKVAELQSKGVKDYMLIQRGNLKNAISLGLFSYQDTVNRRLAELAQEGYKPVVVPRYKTRKETWLELHSDQDSVPTLPEGLPQSPQAVDCKTLSTPTRNRPG